VTISINNKVLTMGVTTWNLFF